MWYGQNKEQKKEKVKKKKKTEREREMNSCLEKTQRNIEFMLSNARSQSEKATNCYNPNCMVLGNRQIWKKLKD